VHDSVLSAHPDADLRVLIVFSAILKTDDRESAAKLARELDDPRARFFWDADKAVGKALKARLGVGRAGFAWDVYCFFDKDAEWTDELPEPARWAHQLAGADPDHYYGGRIGETLRAWTGRLAGGASGAKEPESEAKSAPEPAPEPEPKPEKVITIRAADIRPIPEVLLDKILDDLSKQPDLGVDRASFARLGDELRRRMTAATAPHAAQLPRAVRLGDEVVVVPSGGCATPGEARSPGGEGR